MTLREKLIVLRDKAGITQMTLAHQLGVSRQAVTRWESGDTAPSMDKLKALARIYNVSLDWLCSDAADDKSFEVMVSADDSGANNAITSAEDKKKRKIRYIAIALAVGVITFACIWFAMRPENDERPGKQIEDMKNENVDMPDQGVNGFDFEWKD